MHSCFNPPYNLVENFSVLFSHICSHEKVFWKKVMSAMKLLPFRIRIEEPSGSRIKILWVLCFNTFSIFNDNYFYTLDKTYFFYICVAQFRAIHVRLVTFLELMKIFMVKVLYNIICPLSKFLETLVVLTFWINIQRITCRF